jgi:hypothetical protein
MRRPAFVVLAALALGGVAPGCEVSVFGSEPIQLLGGPGPTYGSEAGRCGEPEETRLVRERLTPGAGEDDPCAFRCVLVDGVLEGDPATCRIATRAEDGSWSFDMSEADALIVRVEVCRETVMHLADSMGARHDGSDDPATSHDAALLLRGGDLDLHPAHGGGLSPSHVEGFVPAPPESSTSEGAPACVIRTLEVTDSVVYLAELERGLCGTSMLRIDPPTDEQGRPDSFWHLALGRTLDGHDEGAPPPRTELCLF